jgi:hypothetical protein
MVDAQGNNLTGISSFAWMDDSQRETWGVFVHPAGFLAAEEFASSVAMTYRGPTAYL